MIQSDSELCFLCSAEIGQPSFVLVINRLEWCEPEIRLLSSPDGVCASVEALKHPENQARFVLRQYNPILVALPEAAVEQCLEPFRGTSQNDCVDLKI